MFFSVYTFFYVETCDKLTLLTGSESLEFRYLSAKPLFILYCKPNPYSVFALAFSTTSLFILSKAIFEL